MNYPGEDRKFMMTASREDFSIIEDPFEIAVKDIYGRVLKTITKGSGFFDEDGRFYFVLDAVPQGIFLAHFTGSYEDEDFDDQRRTFKDKQLLFTAGVCGMDIPKVCGCRKSRQIHYEEVYTVSIDGEDYLCGSDGKYILTSDGKRICFKSNKPVVTTQDSEDMKVRLDTMTAAEFKTFIEGRTPNGEIDTVPELFDAARGISDTETIKGDVNQQIDEGVEQRKASESDIDEIFNK